MAQSFPFFSSHTLASSTRSRPAAANKFDGVKYIHTYLQGSSDMEGILTTTSCPCVFDWASLAAILGNSKYRYKDSSSWCCSSVHTSITQTSVALLVIYRYSCDKKNELFLPLNPSTVGFQNMQVVGTFMVSIVCSPWRCLNNTSTPLSMGKSTLLHWTRTLLVGSCRVVQW